MSRHRTIVAGIAALLISSAAAAEVTLSCDSATGPAGGEVEVAFRFSAEPGDVVGGTQNDILFDNAVFDATSPLGNSPNCTLNPAIGPGTEPDKRLARAFLEDPERVRAIVVSQQNQIEIPQGLLYTCTLQIADEAERREYEIALTDPVVSDTAGDRIASVTANCEIEVVDPPTPTATPTPDGFCEDEDDCPPGEVCVDNRCATTTPTPVGFCEDEEDCPPGEVCVDNRCATTTPTATPEGFCRDDEDCPEDQVCVDDRCATPTPEGFCEEDEDCPEDQVCIDNRCATPTPVGFCEDDEDCPEGEICIDNRCQPIPEDDDSGGGGCSCSVEPDPPLQGALNLLLALVPVAFLLWGRGRRALC